MPAVTADAVLDAAVELARAAAQDVAVSPDDVGEHLGVVTETERVVSHRFVCLARGYRGWEWTVTLARVPRGRTATVSEAELLPGADSILAPPWVPWSERLQPGDLRADDVLPFLLDDDRLEPGYEATDDEDADALAVVELGLGRERVLSARGRADAAERWYTGSHGPTAPVALTAAAPCSTCAFLLPLAGSLRTVFGVCANEWSPDDGRVVSMDHGCGAHSQTDVEQGPSDWPESEPAFDERRLEMVDVATVAPEVAVDLATETPGEAVDRATVAPDPAVDLATEIAEAEPGADVEQ